ncbi:MAG TPA: cytochrome b/b6 domain-containing protein [Burkholderiales bacterium]|nr:cytochrome b/b6 domain-containing protein [Burkholderiales bacterium]
MEKSKVLVWDVPTRLFHWLLALSFTGAFLTAESEQYRDVHVLLGYTVLGLVAFRLVWGLIGTRYARFSSFAYGPGSVLSYIKSLLTRSPQHHLGHNPAGSWAIYALLALSLLAGASGYATYNDIGGRWMEELHEALANTLLGVVFVHIAGVLVSSVLHRENLVCSMITGYKPPKSGTGIRYRHRLIGAALVAAVTAFWIAGPDSLPGSWNAAAPLSATQDHSSDRRHD